MDYLAETDRIPEAFSLLLSMKMAGIIPTAHTYLLKCLFYFLFLSSINFLIEQRYAALLNACMKYEDTDDAMVAFDLMRY